MHPIIASIIGLSSSIPAARQGLRRTPHKNSIVHHKDKLADGYEARLKELGAEPLPVIYDEGNPFPSFNEDLSVEEFVKQMEPKRMGARAAMASINPSTGKPEGPYVADKFYYNPNADASILAHEYGHAVTSKTGVGRKIEDFKNAIKANPKLSLAVASAGGLLPMGIAMATPGDEEYATAALGNLALASPTLINEALATKNGLAIMDRAGLRATMGQRGLLAGALMSYAGVPLLMGATGTAIGNQFDENVPAQ